MVKKSQIRASLDTIPSKPVIFHQINLAPKAIFKNRNNVTFSLSGKDMDISPKSSVANQRVLNWLLEEDQPSIRYLALTELLDRPGNDPEVKEAKRNLKNTGWARDILDKQNPEGYWIKERNLYQPKYVSTNWMLLVLSDLGLTKDEPRIDKACQMWIKRFAAKDRGFNPGGGKRGHLCITGNTARSLVKFGYAEHPKVKRAFEWFVKNQAKLGGWSCWNFGSQTGRNLDSWEPMSAFAVYPRQKWTRSMKLAVERGAEFFLERELHRQGDRYEPWYRFHYPVHYYYDILVGLDFMTALGYSSDKRLEYAISLLKKKRRRDGRWNLDAINPDPESPQGRWDKEHQKQASIPFSLEKPGEPSKMITLKALKILSRIEA
ncbi:MAG: prenyltransferase/squalene oxidase repeat-containing protein [Nitrososphaerales archaeon]